jgi:hypothetical protein
VEEWESLLQARVGGGVEAERQSAGGIGGGGGLGLATDMVELND